MTRDISPDIGTIRLCLTEAHECSYLPGQQSTTAFVDPDRHIDLDLYSRMTTLGFRRSGPYLYAPKCGSCTACVPARIPVASFQWSRAQKRCWKKNNEILVEQLDSINVGEHFPVYARYIEQRHPDGDMYPPMRRQFEEFLGNAWGCTQFLEFRLDSQLIGCAVVDVVHNGLSAIYTYYDPAFADRGLGVLAILFEINLAQRLGLEHLYLGYWISGCDKMKYKTNYRPLELYRENRWRISE
jgi:arginyl-tRNA--protein-N-Asp/Glu arginylyltransferase